MTEHTTQSDSDSDHERIQLGARVDRDLAELVKGLVKHKHGKIRGPLGRSYEKALEYYLGVHLFQNPGDLEAIAEASDIEDTDRAIARLREAVDNVGPDLTGVKQALEDTQQTPPRRREQPVAQVGSAQQLETHRTVLDEEEEWQQSPIRRSVVGDDTVGDDTLDRLAEKIASNDELAEALARKLREEN
ncbi:MAG: hypothetical protein V5A61_05675 [Haloarculaceae archaeon]